jgi:hypothetical protein
MNKDLAGVSAIWRALGEVRIDRFYCLSACCQRSRRKMVLRRILGPSLESGAVLDAVLSVNYRANCDSVSVRAVLEKCDEKDGA